MTTISSSFVTIDGQRYAYTKDSFVRTVQLVELDNIVAKRPESPMIDAITSSFEGGITPDYLNDEGNFYQSALGMQPVSANGVEPFNQLAIGTTVDMVEDIAGTGPASLFAILGANLYVGGDASNNFLKFDGATWTVQSTGINAMSLLAFDGALYVGNGTSGVNRSLDGGVTWTFSFQVQPANGSSATTGGVSVLLPLLIGNTRYLYAIGGHNTSSGGVGAPAGKAIAVRFNLSSSPQVNEYYQFALDEEFCMAGYSTLDTLYLAGVDTAGQGRSTIYSSNGTGITRIATVPDGQVVSMCPFKGKIYLGMTGGQVRVVEGNSARIIKQFKSGQWVWGMSEWKGALYIHVLNDVDNRIEVWRFDGTTDSGAWSMPHFSTQSNAYTGKSIVYGNKLYIAGGTTGGSAHQRIYSINPTTIQTSANLETALAVYGVPNMLKRYLALSVQHSALTAGQSIAVAYNAGSGYQTILTNKRVGSTHTIAPIPADVRIEKLSALFTFANPNAAALVVYSDSIRALPAPDAKYLWSANLLLTPFDGGIWPFDNTSDNDDAMTKLARLQAIRKVSKPIQLIEPFYDDTTTPPTPFLVLPAIFDLQTDLAVNMGQPGGVDALITVPIRMLQAFQPPNLLTNASFEDDAVGVTPTGWPSGGVGGTHADTSNAIAGFDGGKVLRLTFDGTSLTWRVVQTVNGLIPGHWYTASIYLRRNSLTAGSVRLNIIEGSTTYAQTPALAAGTDVAFVRYQVPFLLPLTSSGSNILFQIAGGGTPNGTIYADGAQLEEAVPATDFKERGQ